MLEQLFGSRTRVKLLRLFLANPEKAHYVRELTRRVDERINSVRRELSNLSAVGLLGSEIKDKKKYYLVKKDFVLYEELRSFILKTRVLIEQDLVREIKKLGKISFLALTGGFTGVENPETDVLVVGKIDRPKLAVLIKRFELEFDRDINYTVMAEEEFHYRKEVSDRFLFDILNSKHVVIIDTTKDTKKST